MKALLIHEKDPIYQDEVKGSVLIRDSSLKSNPIQAQIRIELFGSRGKFSALTQMRTLVPDENI